MPSRYVVTFSPLMDTKEDPQAIIIWDILTGQKKRGFHCESSAHWPIFKWVLCFVFHLLSFSNVFTPAVIEYNRPSFFFQVESWWEVLCQDDHRHAEHLWDSCKSIRKWTNVRFVLGVRMPLKPYLCSFQSMGLLDKKSLKISGIK